MIHAFLTLIVFLIVLRLAWVLFIEAVIAVSGPSPEPAADLAALDAWHDERRAAWHAERRARGGIQ